MKRVAFFAEDEQVKNLKALSLATRVKVADYIREGIDLVLARYRGVIKKSRKKGGRAGGKGPGQS